MRSRRAKMRRRGVNPPRRSEAQFTREGPQIGPCLPLLSGLSQQVGGMEHRQRAQRPPIAAMIRKPGSTRAGNSFPDTQQSLGGRRAQTNEDLGGGELDLSLDERQTGLRLLKGWGSIARRAPRNDIGDIDLATVESDRLQHAIEQLSGASDK